MTRTAGILLLTLWCVACGRNERPHQEAYTRANIEEHPEHRQLQHRHDERATPGDFDYYVLSLSWAPTFCESPEHRSARECDPRGHTGFVIHGLWPQREDGRSPEYCGDAQPLGEPGISEALHLMPDAGLARHEWQAHGTCSGLSPRAYFDAMKKAREAIQVPAPYRSPQRGLRTSPSTVEARFAQASQITTPGAIRVHCVRQELAEVRFCLTKSLTPRPCSQNVGECRANPIFMRPVR